ncbi:MAG: rhomboid family intramembrane serine protease [Anaerolineae bacterium]|nr:rhomboid family intramembrane serine protease [Anaerolineae bacterium]
MSIEPTPYPRYNDPSEPEFIPPESAPPAPVRVRLIARRPIVSYILMGLTVFVYLLQMASQFLLGGDYPAYLGMKYNVFIEAGQLWRLFTPIFLHGSIVHIGFNMYALYALGPTLEEQYGRKPFLMLYLISGIAGNVLSFILSPNSSLGASTSIFGLIAGQLIFVYINRAFFGQKAQSMLINIMTIIIINLGLGLTPGIDNWGHLGGLAGGLAFAWFAGPVLQAHQRFDEIVISNQRKSYQAGLTFIIEFLILCGITFGVIYLRTRG